MLWKGQGWGKPINVYGIKRSRRAIPVKDHRHIVFSVAAQNTWKQGACVRYEKWQVTPNNMLWPRVSSTSRWWVTRIRKRTREVSNPDKEERQVTRISKRIRRREASARLSKEAQEPEKRGRDWLPGWGGGTGGRRETRHQNQVIKARSFWSFLGISLE
jgi:hypothetical protein